MTLLNIANLTAAQILANLEDGDCLVTPGARASLPEVPPGVPVFQANLNGVDANWSAAAGHLTLRLEDPWGKRAGVALNCQRVQSLFHVLTLSQVRLVTPHFRTRCLSDGLTTEVTFGEPDSAVSVELRQGDAAWVWLRSVLSHAANRFEIWQSERPDVLDPCSSAGHLPVGFLEARGLDQVFVRAQHGLPVGNETEETAPAWHARAGAGPLGSERIRSLSVGDQVVTPTGERFWVMDSGFRKV